MKKSEIEGYMETGNYEELIRLLEEEIAEEYDELSMYSLARAYMGAGRPKDAKKLLKRMKMLYPAGEYLLEADALLGDISSGRKPQDTAQPQESGSAGENGQKPGAQDTAQPWGNGSTERSRQKPEPQNIAQPQGNGGTKRSGLQTETQKSGRTEETAKQPQENGASVSLAETFRRGKEGKKKAVVLPASIREHFEGVIGLEGVQAELDKFYKLLRFQNERRQNDFQAELLKYTHFAIAGARGSGKTMVGKKIAQLLCEFGVREDDKPFVVPARELAAAYGEKKEDGVAALFEKLEDATIILENLQDILAEDDQNGTAKGITLALEKLMRERRKELSVILTGSVQAVEKLFVLDETLEDALYGRIEIPPYSTMELLAIAEFLARDRALLLSEDGKKALLRKIDMERRGTGFLNVISLGRYLDDAAQRLAQRYYASDDASEEAMVYLIPEDFEMETEDGEDLGELLAQLDGLTGLAGVKGRIKKLIEGIQAEEAANRAGAERKAVRGTLHMVFEGNPGTGKTTVARLMGKIYQQLGVLPRGSHMVECTRSDLVGMYQGHTAQRVREKAREAYGGILFIDEAYALCRDGQDTFGHEAVDELLTEMENNREYLMVILAGYTEEMKEFLKSNPGFNSRIPEKNHVLFEDYSVDELADIFRYNVRSRKMVLSGEADKLLAGMLEVKSKTPDFGNARGVRNLFDEVLEAQSGRMTDAGNSGTADKNAYDTITAEDIRAVAGRRSIGEKTLEELLAELNALTGLAGVKAKVQEMVDDIQVRNYQKEHGIATGADGGQGTLHLVFKGNAGTGKTTVARLIGQIYNKLGVLKKNVFVETGRKDLVAGYQGQTAPRVLAKVKEAEGGILFIDEAYTLVGGENDTFGMGAVGALVAELENRRDSLMVIVAGYTGDMQKFLDANQGLASRFANEIIFEDYNDEELLSILSYMAGKKGLSLSEDAGEAAREAIRQAKSAVRDFGNARGVRNVLEKAVKRKNSRIAAAMRAGETPDKETVTTLRGEDFL